MTRASDAWTALQAALEHTRVACLNDPRFTDDDTPAAAVATICHGCPLLAPAPPTHESNGQPGVSGPVPDTAHTQRKRKNNAPTNPHLDIQTP